tara:strand:- start:867 stop:1478 length:612 start_codon:yes stop_codon:yes gene_type:complete
MNTIKKIRFFWKPLVFFICLIPTILILTDALEITGHLSANPIEDIQDRLGNWGLRFVVLVLTISPLKIITGKNWIILFRRMIGLFAFYYVFMHFLTWAILEQNLNVSAVIEDIIERKFITLGLISLTLLFIMAVTSPNSIRRKMGVKWYQIHKSIYVVSVLGIWHFWWQVKLDAREPLIYAIIISILLLYRLLKFKKPTSSVR